MIPSNAILRTRSSLCLLLACAGLILPPQQLAAAEPSFRIRSDMQAPLNADAGWAGGTNEIILQAADAPFRLRMEAEAGWASPQQVRLQVRRNGGAWERLEAQGFPKPEREVTLDFRADPPGKPPPGWKLVKGSSAGMRVEAGSPQAFLRAAGGDEGLLATYPAPWPLNVFSFAAEFRLGDAGQDFGMLFGFLDSENHGRVQIDAGAIRVIRRQDGRDRLLAVEEAPIEPGQWHELEIGLERGMLTVKFDDDILEFDVSIGADMPPGELGISLPPGRQADIRELVLEGEPRTPPVSIVAAPAYEDAAPTTDLLAGSGMPFVPGFGLSLSELTPPWQASGAHGEFEWPLVIRRFADGAVMNEDGDLFEFRMTDAGDLPLAGAPVAKVRLGLPQGHLGGTFVETPGRIGPWQASNGDLYFIMEPSETDNLFMMMKSADGGKTWSEAGAGNRPETGDLESVDSRQVGDTIHILHQVTHSVRYHRFNTSDHPARPDQWAVRDEVAAEATAIAQMATLAVRPDDSIVAVFLADRLRMAIRSPGGQWGPQVEIDPGDDYTNAGPQAVLGAGGVVHLAYSRTDGSIWYRRVEPDGSLGPRQQVSSGAGTGEAEYGAVLPLVYDAETDTLVIAYRLEDGTLWERRVRGAEELSPAARISTLAVITDAVDSQQPAADMVLDGNILRVLFIDEASRSIFATHDDGGWQAPAVQVEGIEGSWVRGGIVRRPDGRRAYGYVYDAGSQGGSGLNRFGQIVLDSE